MEMRIIKPTSEEIIEALRVCLRENAGEDDPCNGCYLKQLSRGSLSLMSTGHPCYEHLAFDAIELIQRGIIEIAKLKAENSRLWSDAEAAVNDMQKLVVFSADPCEICAGLGDCEICHFQWRGAEG